MLHWLLLSGFSSLQYLKILLNGDSLDDNTAELQTQIDGEGICLGFTFKILVDSVSRPWVKLFSKFTVCLGIPVHFPVKSLICEIIGENNLQKISVKTAQSIGCVTFWISCPHIYCVYSISINCCPDACCPVLADAAYLLHGKLLFLHILWTYDINYTNLHVISSIRPKLNLTSQSSTLKLQCLMCLWEPQEFCRGKAKASSDKSWMTFCLA